MTKQNRIGRLRRAALVACLALAAPLLATMPAQAATPTVLTSSHAECRDGSRDIDVQYPRDIARAALNGGSQGRAEITLRSNADGSCHWGLISGYGQIWLERSSVYGGLYDNFVNPKKNHRDGIKHTAATVTTEHSVRACGLPFTGEVSSSSGWGMGGSLDGRRGGVTIGYNSDNQKVYEYADGTVCTEWHGPDVYQSNLI
jgi:hypothetical protein